MGQREFVVDQDILLKEVSKDEIVPIFSTINNERSYLGKWLPFVENTKEISDTALVVSEMTRNADKSLTCGIYFQKKFAGMIGLKDFDFINRKTEIGYWLSEQYQGKGIVTRSCAALIDYAFDRLDLYRIQLNAAVGNNKSQAVALRLGFTQEGIIRSGELHTRGFLDLVMFSLLKPEWTQ